MQELMAEANGLESLFNYEMGKCSGIINGIDYEVWNPATDTYILDNYSNKDFKEGKRLNKKSFVMNLILMKIFLCSYSLEDLFMKKLQICCPCLFSVLLSNLEQVLVF